MVEVPLSLQPVILIQGRYRGWGAWWAFARADLRVSEGFDFTEDGPNDGDFIASDFYKSPPEWAAHGDTPDEAVRNLVNKSA